MSEATVTTIPTPATGLARLREPFPPECVGKLPRVTQKEGSKSRCAECGGYLPPHIHLDYVGHAEVTDRLLSVDPEWQWEPVAFDENGLPKMAQGPGGELTFWIRLTVCGVTRLGVGSVARNAFDAEKQLISDAIRNAAMRFGVALDLWAKEELESTLDAPTPPPGVDPATGEKVASGGEPGASPPPPVAPPAGPTRRPPPGRARKEKGDSSAAATASATTPMNDSDGGGVPITDGAPTITPAALDSIRKFAARKGLDEGALIEMAGKPLEGLSERESQELTTSVTAWKPAVS